jgi:hypothetical protein
MGQMTFGVLYGVLAEPPEQFEDGWYEVVKKYAETGNSKPSEPSPDGIGYWVAVGASGKDGVPYLEDPFPLTDIASVPEYREAAAKAALDWQKFAVWAKGKGIALDEPKLWLVEVEVS